ncbi:MAG: hypothetical protein K2N72_12800 [Oscillospiraceae bacterium]|nr:hypothetical protein [Oscillospiraceae bacterium]
MSKVRLYPSSLWEDILLCAGISYAVACFNADSYISGKLFTAAKLLAGLLMVLCWWYFSLMNGLRHRKKFLLFTALWQGAMPVTGIIISSVKAFKFSTAGIFLSELANILSDYPYMLMSSELSVNILYIRSTAFIICLLMFGAGYLYTNKVILNR